MVHAASNKGRLADRFPEMRLYFGACRFGPTYAHDREPGCAIKTTVEERRIARRRRESYLSMKGSQGVGE